MLRRGLIPQTLRGRLVLAAGGPIVAAVAFFCAATVVIVHHELEGSLDGALRSRAQEVAQLAVSAPAVLTTPGALESPVSGRQIAVEVLDSEGRIIARSVTLGARLLPSGPLGLRTRRTGQPGFGTIEIAGRQFRIYAAPIADAGGPAAGGVVLVGSDTTDISSTLSHLTLVLILSGAAAALLALLVAAVLTRRGLRPLRRLASAAGEVERTADPSRRLPAREVRDEIGALTGVLNRMLASLEAAQASERRFLADASHELRTPVTTLLGNIEFVVRHGADAEVIRELEREAARLARLVDDLLVLERAGSTSDMTEAVDLRHLVQEVVANSGRDDGRVQIGQLQAARVRGEKEALRRVVENLIDNGLIHGPADGRVTVGLVRHDYDALLTVSDEGPGPDTRHGDRLFERFWRGEETSARPGSGLGLSIVSAIVQRHGGSIRVDGATFTVALRAVEQ